MTSKITPERSRELSLFSKKIGIKLKDPSLLDQSFIHRSFINEHPRSGLAHNERLEFLGDAVLELAVTKYLYTNFSNPEGELTNLRSSLVKGEMLAEISDSLRIGELIKLSRGEKQNGGKARNLILANAFEALIGAVYLDQGFEAVEKLIVKYLLIQLPKIIEEGSFKDSKSSFQEIIQEKEGVTPEYRVIAEEGPDHAKSFTVAVFIGEKKIAEGIGSSKQKAQQEAAKKALNNTSL